MLGSIYPHQFRPVAATNGSNQTLHRGPSAAQGKRQVVQKREGTLLSVAARSFPVTYPAALDCAHTPNKTATKSLYTY